MKHMQKLQSALDQALLAKVPAGVLLMVLLSSNQQRLQALFWTAAKILLSARKEGAAGDRMNYLKAVLDLVRARVEATGKGRPTVEAWAASVVRGVPASLALVASKAA